MAISLNQGAIAIKDGLISCPCCIETDFNVFDIVVGPIGECDCETSGPPEPGQNPDAAVCYAETINGIPALLSPPSLTINGLTYTNQTPNTERFTLAPIFLQGPIFDQLGNITGFQNRVSEPTIVNIFGSVGGDVAISDRAPAGLPSGVDYVPDEGEFPCGICDTPRNGPHAVNINAVLYPNVLFYFVPFTYIRCFPNLRLRVTVLGPVAP